jgi:hypothetical protein
MRLCPSSGLPEQPLVADAIDAPVAPGVAAQQPPAGKDEAAGNTVVTDSLERIPRARGRVLAAPSTRNDPGKARKQRCERDAIRMEGGRDEQAHE